MYVENNADKGFVADKLRNLGMLVKEYRESTNKQVKIMNYLGNAWQDIYIDTELSDNLYIEQIAEWSEVAGHDDAPDSLASIMREHFSAKKINIGLDIRAVLGV